MPGIPGSGGGRQSPVGDVRLQCHFRNGGQSRQMIFSLEPRQLAFVDSDGKLADSHGSYTISMGGQQPESGHMAKRGLVRQKFTIVGEPVILE
jgi:hypothetical protein